MFAYLPCIFCYICDTNNVLCNDKASQHNISVGFLNLVTVFCLDNQTLWGTTAQICRCSLKRKKLHPSWRHQETPADIRSTAWFVSLWLAAAARRFPPCGLLSQSCYTQADLLYLHAWGRLFGLLLDGWVVGGRYGSVVLICLLVVCLLTAVSDSQDLCVWSLKRRAWV